MEFTESFHTYPAVTKVLYGKILERPGREKYRVTTFFSTTEPDPAIRGIVTEW